jgi:DNA-binding CsgD family transcriptional regulator
MVRRWFSMATNVMELEYRPAKVQVDLTARERAVLRLIADGYTATAVARRLAIAPGTVRKHLEHAYFKLGHHDRLTAVGRARQLGLI